MKVAERSRRAEIETEHRDRRSKYVGRHPVMSKRSLCVHFGASTSQDVFDLISGRLLLQQRFKLPVLTTEFHWRMPPLIAFAG